jgi:hypothetical protein
MKLVEWLTLVSRSGQPHRPVNSVKEERWAGGGLAGSTGGSSRVAEQDGAGWWLDLAEAGRGARVIRLVYAYTWLA